MESQGHQSKEERNTLLFYIVLVLGTSSCRSAWVTDHALGASTGLGRRTEVLYVSLQLCVHRVSAQNRPGHHQVLQAGLQGVVSLQKNYSHSHSLLLSQVALKGSGKSQGGSLVLQHFLLELQKER